MSARWARVACRLLISSVGRRARTFWELRVGFVEFTGGGNSDVGIHSGLRPLDRPGGRVRGHALVRCGLLWRPKPGEIRITEREGSRRKPGQ